MQLLAGLEANGFARSDADFGSGARIAADAGFAWADVEDAEATQLDALTLSKSALEGFKDCVDGGFRLIALEAGDSIDREMGVIDQLRGGVIGLLLTDK